jgi:hypothetical protein
MIEYMKNPSSLLAPFQHSRRSAEKRRRRVSTFLNMGPYFIATRGGTTAVTSFKSIHWSWAVCFADQNVEWYLRRRRRRLYFPFLLLGFHARSRSELHGCECLYAVTDLPILTALFFQVVFCYRYGAELCYMYCFWYRYCFFKTTKYLFRSVSFLSDRRGSKFYYCLNMMF